LLLEKPAEGLRKRKKKRRCGIWLLDRRVVVNEIVGGPKGRPANTISLTTAVEPLFREANGRLLEKPRKRESVVSRRLLEEPDGLLLWQRLRRVFDLSIS